jgi:hypothetical protein
MGLGHFRAQPPDPYNLSLRVQRHRLAAPRTADWPVREAPIDRLSAMIATIASANACGDPQREDPDAVLVLRRHIALYEPYIASNSNGEPVKCC